MNKEIFIFTIAYNCGVILKKCLDSYHKYHDKPIHIFGKKEDFNGLTEHKNNVFIDLSDDIILAQYYTHGHIGTAYIWAKVIKIEYGDYDKIIQIDSDVIFLDECLSDITNKLDLGYDLVGPRRSYITMPNYNDVVSTYFIGVNINKISDFEFKILHKMAAGHYNPLGHKVIDFFDPISFNIISNGGLMHILDFKEYGSSDENNNFDNGCLEMNTLYDCGSKILHFAGIGSGMNFYKNGSVDVPITYVNWAKKRYSLYMKLFYDEDIDVYFDEKDYILTKNYLNEKY